MQENEFEKSIRQKMDEFALAPDPAIWQKVEASIRQKRKRRALFTWISSVALLVGFTSILLIMQPGKQLAKEETSKPSTTTNDHQNIQSINQPIKETNKDEEQIAEARKAKVGKVLIARTEHTLKKINKVLLYEPAHENDHSKAKDVAEITDAKPQKNEANVPTYKALVESKQASIEHSNHDLPPHKYYLGKKADEQEKSVNDVVIEKKTANNDTTSIATKYENTRSIKFSKWKLGVSVNGGMSDNVRGFSIAMAKSADAYYASPTSGIGSTYTPALTYKSGGSFSIGAYIKKDLSKHVDLSLGINYQLLSSASHVGNKTTSTLTLYDTALQKETVINNYYTAGNNTKFSNKYHLIQLPVNFQFKLNDNKNPLIFSLGLSPSYLVGTNALYLNKNERIYYTEKRQFKHLLFFTQTAILAPIINTTRYTLTVGPTVQYNVNDFSKWQAHTRQHLLFYGIQTNFTFK